MSKGSDALAKKVQAFWSWFAKGPGKWKAPGDDFDEQGFLAIDDRLRDDFPGLAPEFSWMPGKGFELTLSLVMTRDEDARKAALPAIRALAMAAPKMKTWKVIAFAPKVAWMDAFLPQLELPGNGTLAIAGLKFEVLSAKPLALRVFVPKFTKSKERAFRIAVERVLEAGMGEAWVLEKLARLEVGDAKLAPKKARPLPELESR